MASDALQNSGVVDVLIDAAIVGEVVRTVSALACLCRGCQAVVVAVLATRGLPADASHDVAMLRDVANGAVAASVPEVIRRAVVNALWDAHALSAAQTAMLRPFCVRFSFPRVYRGESAASGRLRFLAKAGCDKRCVKRKAAEALLPLARSAPVSHSTRCGLPSKRKRVQCTKDVLNHMENAICYIHETPRFYATIHKEVVYGYQSYDTTYACGSVHSTEFHPYMPLLTRVIQTFARGLGAWGELLAELPIGARFELHVDHALDCTGASWNVHCPYNRWRPLVFVAFLPVL
jgi:hypothetical protein